MIPLADTKYPENVIRALAEFEERRQRLLSVEAQWPLECDTFGSRALTALLLGRDMAVPNAILRHCADWFENTPPAGMALHGECDFVAVKLCRAYHQFADVGRLEHETIEKIRAFFLHHDFFSIYQSENHAFLFHTSRCLMAQAWPEDVFDAYGEQGRQIIVKEQAWLKQYIRFRASSGWGEFNSVCYLAPVWECLSCLYDFSSDSELKQLAGMMMTLLLGEMAVNSLNGMYCGAHGRIYPAHALDHETEPTRLIYYLYFGGKAPRQVAHHSFTIDLLSGTYRTHPITIDIARNRSFAYENRERKHLHNLADVLPISPLQGSIRKYTYATPEYVLGCVQYQDAYPEENGVHEPHCEEVAVPPEQRQTSAYALHQQHQWDLSFSARTDARIFTHHPGEDGTHNYWTGDRQCGCGSFFQHQTALIALYDIPKSQPLLWIHAYVPKAAFDEVVERDGIIFIRSGMVGVALRLLPCYRWTTDGEWKNREVISDGARHGVICETAKLRDFGGFATFQEEMLANAVQYDSQAMTITYHSKRAGVLKLNKKGERTLNGQPVDLDYATYDSPYIQSAWKSGYAEMTGSSGHRLILNFTNGSIVEC